MMPLCAKQSVAPRAAAAGKEGVAIILVLGMLALLMLMAVAFSITMRIERVGAGNFAQNINTRQLVWAGLARAIDDINAEMQPGNPDFIYPTWDVLPSWTASGGSKTPLSWGKIKDHIPGSLRGAAAGRAQWIDIASDSVSGAGGSVAYMVVNLSDCLDANYAGGSTNRGFGTNSAALQIARFNAVADPVYLEENRQKDLRYDTLPEFHDLQYYDYLSGAGLTNIVSDNFVTYSRYPHGFLTKSTDTPPVYSTDDTPPVYIGGPISELLTKRAEIEAALVKSVAGCESAHAATIFTNLIDYLDADSIPGNLDGTVTANLASACTERVPMLNEVYPQIRIKADSSGKWVIDGRVYVEWVYPFAEPSAESFEVEATISITADDGAGARIAWTNILTEAVVLGPTESFFTMPNCHRIERFNLPDKSYDSTNSMLTDLEVIVSAKMLLADGTTEVDSMPGVAGDPGLTFSTNDVSLPFTVNFRSMEAVDPRFNWEVNQWKECDATNSPSTADPAAINSRTGQLRTRPEFVSKGRDWDIDMRVANGGRLHAVGELGYLLRGLSFREDRGGYFRSIRLLRYGNNAPDRVLDYFTVVDPAAEPVRRGLCNLNSLNEDRLAVAFYGTGFSYPGRADAKAAVTDADARLIANAMIDWRGTNRFDRLSDIGNFEWRDDLTAPAALGERTDNELESLIAHSAGLFGVRQNLFGILVVASPASSRMGIVGEKIVGSLQSAQRAFVTVWRDPYPDAEGQNRCFVQSFQWITDD